MLLYFDITFKVLTHCLNCTVNKNGSKTGHFEFFTKSVYSSKIDVVHKKNDTQTPKMQVLTGLTQYDKDFPLIFIAV